MAIISSFFQVFNVLGMYTLDLMIKSYLVVRSLERLQFISENDSRLPAQTIIILGLRNYKIVRFSASLGILTPLRKLFKEDITAYVTDVRRLSANFKLLGKFIEAFLHKIRARPSYLLRPYSMKTFSERPFSEKSIYPHTFSM